MDQEVADARARLAAKFGQPSQIGGKGTLKLAVLYSSDLRCLICLGTQRRMKKTGHTKNEQASKEAVKLSAALKKYGKFLSLPSSL